MNKKCDICDKFNKKPYGKTPTGIAVYLSTLLVILDCGVCGTEISCCQNCIGESKTVKCKSCRRNEQIDNLI
jgi:predicted RNA-binding Zn-ribbon protein involved in translation (DUF1610 family)